MVITKKCPNSYFINILNFKYSKTINKLRKKIIYVRIFPSI